MITKQRSQSPLKRGISQNQGWHDYSDKWVVKSQSPLKRGISQNDIIESINMTCSIGLNPL
jgi:hypothetical protein